MVVCQTCGVVSLPNKLEKGPVPGSPAQVTASRPLTPCVQNRLGLSVTVAHLGFGAAACLSGCLSGSALVGSCCGQPWWSTAARRLPSGVSGTPSAASSYVCPVSEAAEQLAVGDAGRCLAVSVSRRRTRCLRGRA